MILCPICETYYREDALKAHLADAHTFELLQRLKNPNDRAIWSLRATGLHLSIEGDLIKDLIIEGDLWAK